VTRSRQELGRSGENRAAEVYEKNGYRVIERNWRVRAGEIDLVLERKKMLVFCEVKTRSSDRFGTAAEAVGLKKQRQVRSVATAYLSQRSGRAPAGIRFDVAAVTPDGVEIIENAF